MAEADAKPAAALDLDLAAAFASVARALLRDAGRGDMGAAKFMQRFGIDGRLETEVRGGPAGAGRAQLYR
eukprot:11211347-Lingulodinium_polyedra.AAC.1